MGRFLKYLCTHCTVCIFMLFAVGSCSTSPSAFAASRVIPSTIAAEQLQTDERLQHSISIDESCISIDALLKKLRKQGLILTAGRSCAEQKLQLRVKQRPLHVLMRSLAQLLPVTWQSYEDGRGYHLEMQTSAVRRRENWWHLFLGEREKALEAQRTHILKTMRSEPRADNSGPVSVEGNDAEVDAQFTAEHNFFRDLPASLQERIAENLNDVPFYTQSNAAFGTDDEEGAIVISLRDLPASAQNSLRQQIRQRIANNAYVDANFLNQEDISVQFTNGGFALYASVALPDGRGYAALNLQVATAFDALSLRLDHTALAQEVRRKKGNVPDAWKRLAEYQESRVWKNTLPADFRRSGPPPLRADILEWLGKKADIEYIADYYALPGQPLSPEQKASPLTRPLEEELNFRAAELDMSWKQRQDGLVLFRHNRWYRDDNREVPMNRLQEWTEARTRLTKWAQERSGKEPLSRSERIKPIMDQHADFVTKLTPWQITAGLQWFAPSTRPDLRKITSIRSITGSASMIYSPWLVCPFLKDADILMHQYRTTQFYASLDDRGREALLEGRLPFLSLTPAQREQAFSIVPSLRAKLSITNPPFLGITPRFEIPPDAVAPVPLSMRLVVTSPNPDAALDFSNLP